MELKSTESTTDGAFHALLANRGPFLAAAVAAAAAAPSLGLPFQSDDWIHTLDVSEGSILTTSFNFFRPLCSLTYWIDWQIWGMRAAPFHLTNVLLAAATAAMVVVLARRYTGDAVLATTAGIVFALHPYHIGAVAWISARSDLLSAVLLLIAAWAFDRWRDRASRVPILSLVLYESAMLAKESAVVLPAFLIVVELLGRRRRLAASGWLRAYLPLLLVGLAHFTVVRATVLEGVSLNHLKWIGEWRGSLLSYGASAVVPAPPELLQERPWFWGALAAVVTGGLLLAALLRTRRVPPVIWPSAVVFVALLGPSLIGFKERYFFLPSAAGAMALAALLRAAGARVGGAVAGLLLVAWLVSGVERWTGWYVSARASERFMNGLVQASQPPDLQRVVVAGAPHRVHGVPVTTDYSRVVPFLGGREVAVRTATEFDYPSDRGDALAAPGSSAVRRTADHVELLLSVGRGPYSRCVLPRFVDGADLVVEDWATVFREGRDSMRVRIPRRQGTRAYVWKNGNLVPLPLPGETAESIQ